MSSAEAGRKKSKKKQTKKGTNEKKMPRAVVIRYPNSVITNWSGVMLDPAIRDHFTVGNIVRIPIAGVNGGCQAPYFRILQDLGDGKFRGRVEDPYLDEEWSLVRNGEERVFSRRHVMEVPLTWDGNANLEKVCKLRPFGRPVTGVIF